MQAVGQGFESPYLQNRKTKIVFLFYGKIFEKLGKGKKEYLKVDCFVREVISRRVEK